jgi:glycosyltransferase involved in cell wall biosynthesis
MTATRPTPLVSCLMVTRDRARLAQRALACCAAQTWPSIELVIVDDGAEDYEPVLAPFRDRLAIRYLRLAPDPSRKLGGLRNLALDAAAGDFCVQWDDDEWYHPERVAAQMAAIERLRVDAVVLKWTLMHVDSPDLGAHLYRADAGAGTPGTILHRRTAIRYPNLRRSEDARFLDAFARRSRVGVLGRDDSHLFIRCYHGANTWEAAHFHKRLRRTPLGLAHYLLARLRGDIRTHPAFRLTTRERRAATDYLSESRALGLLAA